VDGAEFRREFSLQPIGPNRISAKIIEVLAELYPSTLVTQRLYGRVYRDVRKGRG